MLILGSASPRRKELLESAGIDFRLIPSDFDESSIEVTKDVEGYVKVVAQAKAYSLLKLYPNHTILTADTIVTIDNIVLGKPKDFDEAVSMLERLSGKTHKVYTAVCIINDEKEELFVESASVTFKKLSLFDIKMYCQTNEPMDKAGAYAIQGEGSKFIDKYEGDFHTIMGLPLKEVINKLNKF
ncbi:Maf family protein [Acholeplasma granularum]|uniref:Maf family protein n=1 Tax=Acholeplasma granularum TaxID=264635 RepID=UPI00046F87B3|nr:Maf family protein [Acholeplasma granularum]